MKKYIRWGICVLLFGGMLLFWGTVQGDEETFRNRLITDWMYQDYGLDLSGCFTSSDSCQLETAMIEKVLAEIAVWNEENGNELDGIIDDFRKQLESFKVNGLPGSDPVWRDLYLKCCEQRRRLRLESVLEHCPDIVYTKHYVIGASHYAYTEDVTDETFNDYSCNRSPGGQLCQMTLREDGTIENKVLYETKEGTIRDPDISWDGKRILFSMRKNYVDDDFHLYEYNTENGEVRQLTFSTGFADIEPVYLPNGDLLFGSTRCVQLTDCWWTEVANFYTCDKDGRFLRRVTKDQVTTNYPKLLDDGRIIYTRWDYNDRGQIFPQPLFVMNADGTGQTEYYGNNSFFPTTVMHARGIPGTNKLLAIASGHHTYQQGKLILIDRSKGTQENSGCTLIAPVRETPDDHIDAYGQDGELFQYPYPIDENNFLVTYLPEGSMGRSYKIPFGIYWMNLNGNRELLVWDPSISSNQEIPLASRPVPPVRPSQVDLEKKTAEYYVQNVYEGPGLQGVEPGTVKSLRVVALDFRTAGIHSNFNSGEAGGGMVSTPVSTINGTWDVKKVLGHVPVEEDGSAYFEVPAMTPVYFQLLDSNDDVVQTMRSWSTLQPGESFACVGCHEPKENVVGNINPSVASIALTKGCVKPVPPYEPPRGAYQNTGFSFIRDIQPILDMRCVSCHTGGENVDGTQAPFSLKGDTLPVTKDDQLGDPGRAFSESYMNLTECGHRTFKYVNWLDVQGPPSMLPPYTAGACKSPLIQMFRGERSEVHKSVEITEAELKRLALWIDLLIPYCGDYLEANTWSSGERAYYAYYEMKQRKMDEIVRQNIEKKIAVDKGEMALPDPESFVQFTGGGLAARTVFVNNWLNRVGIPVLGKKSGEENVYRNLALNPEDVQREPGSFPHVSTNSEFGYYDCFAAKNVIDGRKENKGHGDGFPSWGPNLRDDLYLQIDFGHEVETDKVVLWFRADFPHDTVWESGTLTFSDGSSVDIKFEKTGEPQTFTFDKRKIEWIRLTNLKSSEPAVWKGISEFEVWGKSAESRYEKAIRKYEEEGKANPPASDSTFFVGSSTFTRWKKIPEEFAEFHGVNRGFGGSQISDWLLAADRIVTPWKPGRIVFWCGGNDIAAGKSPDHVLNDFKKLINILRANNPDLPIHYCFLPHAPIHQENWEKYDQYNQMLREMAEQDPHLYLIDYQQALDDENGVTRQEFYEDDRLHFNEEGYEILKSFIIGSLRKESP